MLRKIRWSLQNHSILFATHEFDKLSNIGSYFNLRKWPFNVVPLLKKVFTNILYDEQSTFSRNNSDSSPFFRSGVYHNSNLRFWNYPALHWRWTAKLYIRKKSEKQVWETCLQNNWCFRARPSQFIQCIFGCV